jgi:AraC-like DNA-binding protein
MVHRSITHNDIDRTDDGRPVAVRTLVVDALLRRAVADALETPLTPQPRALAMWQLERVARHIDANISRSIQVVELAVVAELSPSYFSRLFRVSIGMSPHAFIVAHRMAIARHLLANSSLPVLEVALECGLASQPHFCRLFRCQVGISPGAWRRRQRMEHQPDVQSRQTVAHGLTEGMSLVLPGAGQSSIYWA